MTKIISLLQIFIMTIITVFFLLVTESFNFVKADTTNFNPNASLVSQQSQLTDNTWQNNFHYNNPAGRSNDIQTIIPNYDKKNRIKNWDGYYLWNINSMVDGDFSGNQWYHFKTSNFSQFSPVDKSNAVSLNNVAIPNKSVTIDGNQNVEVQDASQKQPWNELYSGMVILNNTKAKGKSWIKKDQWGNSVSSKARLAYIYTPKDDNDQAGIYLAYSNHGEQFHPVSDKMVMNNSNVQLPTISDFRDPYITTCNKGKTLVAYLGGGTNQKIYVLTSNDGLNWQYQPSLDMNMASSTIMSNPNLSNALIETPYVTTINKQPIMFFGSQRIADNSQSRVGYITGYYNKKGIFQFNTSGKSGTIDDWIDNYAGNFTPIDADHLAYVGWLGNWGYSYLHSPHIGGFTLPRIISWSRSNGVQSIPIDPDNPVVTAKQNIDVNKDMQFNDNGKVLLNFNQPVNDFNLTLKRSNNNNQIIFQFNNGNLTINRLNSDNGATNYQQSITLSRKTLSNVQLYLDKSAIEAYIPEVQKMFTIIDYNSTDSGYTLNGNVRGQVINYQFNQKQSPKLIKANLNKQLNQITQIKNKYSQIALKKLKGKKLSNFKKERSVFNRCAYNLNYYANDNAENIKKISQYKGDARQHFFIILANNDNTMFNVKLNQAKISLNVMKQLVK